MWLIDTETFKLESFQGGSPRYAVLSHTWGSDEVTFADFHDQHNTTREKKAGYHKIKLTCEHARKDGIRYAWIDTCCINKESSAELSEAINSMFKWYRLATVCYAYLEDYPQNDKSVDFSLLQGCKWFSRGWTLQELLAPRDLIFFVPHEESWRDIGRKDALIQVLEQITNIPGEILLKQKAIETISVAARMSWAARRQTTREEDVAYCLMGIFNINMPLLYGEGPKAFIRLQEEIMRETRDDSLFAWCSTQGAAILSPYRGLFAHTPEEFVDSADIEHFDTDVADDGSTTSVLGQGRVSLSCSMHPAPEGNGMVVLGLRCFRGDISKIQGIKCIRIGGNYYQRSRPSQLFPCSLGSLTSVTIDKHALNTEANKDDHVYRRDSIYLGDLPDGLHLRGVHSEVAGSSSRQKAPTNGLVPVLWAVGRKMAFEIEIERYVSGDRTQSGCSVENRRLLILFWVDTIAGSRSYKSRFSLEQTSSQDAATRFGNAMRPSQLYHRREITIGRVVICVRNNRRKVGGQEVIYFHVSTEDSKNRRAMIRTESRHGMSEAGIERQHYIRVMSSSERYEVGPLRQDELHSRTQAQEEARAERLVRLNNLTRHRLMRFLKTGLCVIVTLAFFTFISGDLKLAFLITSFWQ